MESEHRGRRARGGRGWGDCIALCVSVPLLVASSGDPSVVAPLHSALDPQSTDAQLIARLWTWMWIAGAVVLLAVTALLAAAIWPSAASRRVSDHETGHGETLHGETLQEETGHGETRASAHDPERIADDAGPDARRRWLMVLTGGVVAPAVAIVALVVAGLSIGARIAADAEPGALTIDVVGHKWWWGVHYLDSTGARVASTANEIHVPAEREVRIRLSSRDVIHSFWVPSLQGKTDMIPGRENVTRLRAAAPGVYRGQCAEFCGRQHALMGFLVVAQPPDEFETWLARQREAAAEPTSDAAMRGQEVFGTAGCAGCHSIRGTAAQGVLGPDLTHLASRRSLGAAILPNTREHLGRWVADAQALKSGVAMPASGLGAEDQRDLLAYLESLR